MGAEDQQKHPESVKPIRPEAQAEPQGQAFQQDQGERAQVSSAESGSTCRLRFGRSLEWSEHVSSQRP